MPDRPSRTAFEQCLLGCRLFRFFFAASRSPADHFTIDGHFHLKHLIVIGARFSNHRLGRKTVEPSLTPLLDLRFVVVFSRTMSLADDMREFLLEQPGHHAT